MSFIIALAASKNAAQTAWNTALTAHDSCLSCCLLLTSSGIMVMFSGVPHRRQTHSHSLQEICSNAYLSLKTPTWHCSYNSVNFSPYFTINSGVKNSPTICGLSSSCMVMSSSTILLIVFITSPHSEFNFLFNSRHKSWICIFDRPLGVFLCFWDISIANHKGIKISSYDFELVWMYWWLVLD